MKNRDLKDAPVIRYVYTCDKYSDAAKVITYAVVHETENQIRAREEPRGQFSWVATFNKADGRVFDSREAALQSKAESLQRRIEHAKNELQRLRSALGMVESELKRSGKPSTVDAVLG